MEMPLLLPGSQCITERVNLLYFHAVEIDLSIAMKTVTVAQPINARTRE
jgi:hypothetical protein